MWLGLMIVLFFVGMYFMKKRALSFYFLSYENQMDTTYVVNPVSARGGLFYDDFTIVVSANSELVENNQGYVNWNFYRKTDPSTHALSHLPGPYYMYKAANNDTIIVIKDVKFKMPQQDTVSRRKRLLRD